MATCLIEVAEALGRPPFQGALCSMLALYYWYLAFILVLLWHSGPPQGLSVYSSAMSFALITAVLASFLVGDMPARDQAVGKLYEAATKAAALRDRLPHDTPLPSLRAVLVELADRCSATLQRDRDRLNALRRNVPAWQRPFRALWRMAQQAAAAIRRRAAI